MMLMHCLFALAVATSPGAADRTATVPAAQVVNKPTDSDLTDRIAHRLDVDPVVHKYDLKVAVTNGVATVKGTVATAAQKAQAGKLAAIGGVTKVDNQVTVDKDVDKSLADKAKAGLSKTGEAITDAWITTKVKFHFTGEDLLSGSDINVDTANKVVTLKGTVRTAAGKARAVALARQTDGVVRVVDTLVVKAKL